MENKNNPCSALEKVLIEAFEQAAIGKGKERHTISDTQLFENQPIMAIPRLLRNSVKNYPQGLAYQAIKKIVEAFHMDDQEKATHELKGAINYIGASILAIRELKIPVQNKPVSCRKICDDLSCMERVITRG